MSSRYVDTTSVLQVIGNVFNNPSLLDAGDKYVITEDDFDNEFHKIVFGCIYKVYELGAKKVTLENINDFLAMRPKSEAIYRKEKGDEWLLQVSESAISEGFDYYYNRMKKFSLLRAFDKLGIDVSFIYDPDNILDSKKKQLQEEQLDNTPIEELANKVTDKVEAIKAAYVDSVFGEAYQAGEEINDLIERLKETPEVGIPMYGPLINTVTRGARLRKMYLRSAPTGIGKSRTMVADACYFACNEIYDEMFGWIKNGTSEPTLYISTEQEKEEIQTMMLAFLSAVNEEHILNGTYVGDEEERVLHAAEIISKAPLYIEELPDFSLKDVEDTIKKNIREHDVKYVCHDYIMTSLKILEEVTKRSGGVKLREDNILFMLSRRLKDLANKYGVFILSATQLNGSYQDSETPDQNLLRGAKSIADSIDLGMILLPVRQNDLDSLESVLASNAFEKPNLKISVYKNRRGRYKGVYLWCRADLGTCRVKPMFCTDYMYEVISIEDLKIMTEERSAF